MARRASKKKTITIPAMADVEGKRSALPEGEYMVEVEEVNQKEGQSGDYLEWVLKVTSKEGKGAKLYYITSLTPQSLWNLRGVLEAIGVEPPDDETEMDVEDIIGRSMMVVVEHEQYEGRARARVVDYYPAAGDGDKKPSKDDDEEDEKPAKKSSKKDDDDEEDDRAARRRERRAERKKAKADEDDGDEDEKPAPKKAAGKKSKQPKLSEDEIASMDEESLGEVVTQYDLDVDLDDLATMRKKRAAVTSALDEAGMLEA